MNSRGRVGKMTLSPVLQVEAQSSSSFVYSLVLYFHREVYILCSFLILIFDWGRSVRYSLLSSSLPYWSVHPYSCRFIFSFVAHDNVLQPFCSVNHLGVRVKRCFPWTCLTDLTKKDRINEYVLRQKKIRYLLSVSCINERTIRMN